MHAGSTSCSKLAGYAACLLADDDQLMRTSDGSFPMGRQRESEDMITTTTTSTDHQLQQL
jgi:hypothetical protein